ncbi:MAG: acetyl-CoA carboxylase biotin carboxylase subunit [Alphaproteobacteria bacterium]|nr:acetyl-CoA carboxylase biotin carboxylase subunit [Alphaproteobacteria bacterium]
MFEKVLIANRGEVALRINRACHEMGIKTVAVHSTADKDAMHVRLADEAVCIGGPQSKDSYLNKTAIISAAIVTGADAIHPGYGFLSENADFAEMVIKHGISFIGPTPEQMRLMGDKIESKRVAIEAGLPVTKGSPALEGVEDAKKWANEIGYPVIIKAKDGGGGKGMKTAFNEQEVETAFLMAKAEAKSSFTSDVVFMEKYLQKPRHIEIQILADMHGNVIHLGERDCSIQRKHQKLVEETPSPALNQEKRDEICDIVCSAIKKIGYVGAGTLEFLFEDNEFYFLEMNTRLQVEHPITEAVTDIDIVREQIKIANGAKLGFTQKDVNFHGVAIECRINAENPFTFVPCPGMIAEWHVPGGLGVRVDSEAYSGYKIPPFYDSMIAKLIVRGTTRSGALLRLKRALREFVIGGMETTLPLHDKITSSPEFVDGMYNIHWLENFLEQEINKNNDK